jgi:hypothetical protein
MLFYIAQIDETCPDCAQYTTHLRTKLQNEITKRDKVANAVKLGAVRRWIEKHALDQSLDDELRALLEGIEQ